MKEGFRQCMAWLHTWTGLLFGWLLFAIFLTGTLAYFKDEISRWMQADLEVRAAAPATTIAFAQDYLQREAGTAARWIIRPPDSREPALSLRWKAADQEGQRGNFTERSLDPVSGSLLQPRETRGGEFFYRFHFQLQMPYPWGRWLSTAAAMLMFIALISGIITHKKIFKDFFTFRPRKGQRSWLDGHNAVGVLVLPFHLMITYSSLVIFMAMVMPASILVSYDNPPQSFYNELFPSSDVPKPAGKPAAMVAFGPLVEQARAQWDGGQVGLLVVNNPGDQNARVAVVRRADESIAREPGMSVIFDGVSGAQLSSSTAQSGLARQISATFYGLHLGRFADPLVRWLYFFFGLAGTAMIGTGLVIWLGKRRLKHEKSAALPFELRLVEVLNIASMAGLMVAVAAFFWANRLIPASLAGRADWEIDAFFGAWGLMLLHALLRPGRRAWLEQLLLGAVLFALVPLLNALTTRDNLWQYALRGDWALFGFDLTCLGSGLFLGWAAYKMQRAAALKALPKPARHNARRAATALEPETN